MLFLIGEKLLENIIQKYIEWENVLNDNIKMKVTMSQECVAGVLHCLSP